MFIEFDDNMAFSPF